MRKTLIVSALLLSLGASKANAESSWLDTIKNMLGVGSSTSAQSDEKQDAVSDIAKQLPSANGLVTVLTDKLGVNAQQASGGLGALLNYAKQNVSSGDFASATQQVPGLEALLSAAPDVSELKSGGLSGILNKAAEYNETLQALNTLNQQFEALGLDTAMILKYVEQAKAYLDTPAGQSAKEMLQKAFANFQA